MSYYFNLNGDAGPFVRFNNVFVDMCYPIVSSVTGIHREFQGSASDAKVEITAWFVSIFCVDIKYDPMRIQWVI